jgi:hypothetical protein
VNDRIPFVIGIRYRSRKGSVRFHDTTECDTEENRERLGCLPPPNYPITQDMPEAAYNCDACGKRLNPA